MSNLEKFSLQKMNKKEMNALYGGSWVWVYRAVSAVWEATKYSASKENAERFYGNNADNPLSGAKL